MVTGVHARRPGRLLVTVIPPAHPPPSESCRSREAGKEETPACHRGRGQVTPEPSGWHGGRPWQPPCTSGSVPFALAPPTRGGLPHPYPLPSQRLPASGGASGHCPSFHLVLWPRATCSAYNFISDSIDIFLACVTRLGGPQGGLGFEPTGLRAGPNTHQPRGSEDPLLPKARGRQCFS